MSVDATGTSNGAVYLSGCASTEGRYGKGLALDGESYARVNDDPALELGASDWTIEAWAKLDYPVTSGEVVSKWADGGKRGERGISAMVRRAATTQPRPLRTPATDERKRACGRGALPCCAFAPMNRIALSTRREARLLPQAWFADSRLPGH